MQRNGGETMSDTPRTDATEREANTVHRDGTWRAFSPTESKGWALARQLERELNAALIAAGCASKERGEWAAERESLTISQAAIKYAQSFVEAEDENRNDFNDRRISFVMREVAKVGSVLAVGESCVGGWIGRDQWSCRCGAKIPEQCKTETAKP